MKTVDSEDGRVKLQRLIDERKRKRRVAPLDMRKVDWRESTLAEERKCLLIQSHNWGNDVSGEDYQLPFSPSRIVAVYENMVTGYCGGGDHLAVGSIVRNADQLMDLVGTPGGYQHCRLEIVLQPAYHGNVIL